MQKLVTATAGKPIERLQRNKFCLLQKGIIRKNSLQTNFLRDLHELYITRALFEKKTLQSKFFL